MDMRFWLEQKFLDMGELFVGHGIFFFFFFFGVSVLE